MTSISLFERPNICRNCGADLDRPDGTIAITEGRDGAITQVRRVCALCHRPVPDPRRFDPLDPRRGQSL